MRYLMIVVLSAAIGLLLYTSHEPCVATGGDGDLMHWANGCPAR